MVRIIILGALILALIVGTFYGCGARGEVAKDKVLAQIDKVLGELEVKRTEIEQNRRKLVKEVQSIREKRIETEVRLEQMESKKQKSQLALDEAKRKLAKLREVGEQVKTEGSIELNNKTYTEEDIKASAKTLTKRYTTAQGNAKNMDTSIGALSRSVNFLRDQENKSKELMEQLDTKIAEIDGKKIAVDAVRQATSVAGDDKSINDRFQTLNKEIDELFISVETQMRLEEEKLDEIQVATSVADELLAEPESLDSTLEELDALLGDDNGSGQ